MTKQEKIVVSAYTGVLMCDFDDLHEYIEDKLGSDRNGKGKSVCIYDWI